MRTIKFCPLVSKTNTVFERLDYLRLDVLQYVGIVQVSEK